MRHMSTNWCANASDPPGRGEGSLGAVGGLDQVVELPCLGAGQERRELCLCCLDDHVRAVALAYEDFAALGCQLKTVALRVRRERGLLPLNFHYSYAFRLVVLFRR